MLNQLIDPYISDYSPLRHKRIAVVSKYKNYNLAVAWTKKNGVKTGIQSTFYWSINERIIIGIIIIHYLANSGGVTVVST